MTLSYGINRIAVRTTRWAVSRRWWVLMLWQLLWSIVHLRSHGYGWHCFVSGARTLFSSNGLNLYSTNAELQIGPLTLVAVAPFAFAPRQIGQASALAAMTILGLVLLRQIEGLYRSGRAVEASGPATHHPSGPRRDDGDTSAVRFLLVGLCVIPVWSELAIRFAHFDDVLALLCAVIAVRPLKRSRWDLWPALLLGLSVDCKPWAAVFLPLLWLAPPGRRWLSVTVGLLSVAVAWLPFYIADPSSLSAVSFRIPIADASVIHLLGIVGGTPAWSRPAQLLTGAALASVAIYRGRWPAVGLARHVGSNCETVMGSLMTQTRTCEPVHWPQASEIRTPLMSEASSVKSSTTVRARSWTSVKPANVLFGLASRSASSTRALITMMVAADRCGSGFDFALDCARANDSAIPRIQASVAAFAAA